MWDRHLTAELDQAVDRPLLDRRQGGDLHHALSSIRPRRRANGTPFPENDPARMRAFNKLLVGVADSHRDRVTLIDLNKLVDPRGVYQSVVDGVTVRSTDGVHLTKAGGEWLQASILPTVATLGLAARTR